MNDQLFTTPDPASSTTGSRPCLASRWDRLGAAPVDELIVGTLILIYSHLIVGTPWQLPPTRVSVLVMSMVGLSLYLLVNGYSLSQSGQTVGKKLLAIQILRSDGSPAGLPRIATLRTQPLFATEAVPYVGRMLRLLDVLFNFREDKRCIHDIITGTGVVDYEP